MAVHDDVAAYRGRDGKQLWARSFAEGDTVFAVPARVGAAGKRGVVFVSYAGLSVGVAGDGGVTLSAVDGRGTELWARQIPGVWAGACALVECAGADAWAVVEDELDAVKGPATDLLVGVVTMSDPGPAWVEHEHFLVVSGADGALTDTGAFVVQANGWIAAAAAPDVSRDGLADFAVLTGDYDADITKATAYPGAGGPALWTSPALPGARARAVVAVGDTNSDRTPELAVTDAYADSRNDEAKAHLVDGKTGTRRWTKPGKAAAIGDVNRDRKADVALFRYATQGRASVRAEVYDNAGKLRWRTSRALPAGSEGGTPIPPPPPPPPPRPGETSADAAATRIETFIGLGGGMNADGVPDVGYSIVVTPEGDKVRRDEGWLDGRTGRVRRNPASDLVMLSGAVDGRGDDSVVTTLTRGRLTVPAYAGDSGRLLWRTTVAVSAGYRSPYNRAAVRLTSWRCADVLVAVSALAVTLIAVEVVGDSRRHWQLTAPRGPGQRRGLYSHPGLVVDPADGGVRETRIVVASTAPLTFLDVRYTVQFADDAEPVVAGDSFGKAKVALPANGMRLSTFAITEVSPDATLVPAHELVAFALAKPAVPRLARLEAHMAFADPVGRRMTTRVSALPEDGQRLEPPVSDREHEPVG